MNPYSKKELYTLLLLLVLSVTVSLGSRSCRLYQPDAVQSETPEHLYIDQRIGLDSLALKLDSLNVQYDREELQWAGRVLGWRNFRPGLYIIDGAHSYEEFLANLARGIQDPATVTVLPGIDPDRLAFRLAIQLQADEDKFREVFTDSSSLARELNLTGEELFSRMLPNTYKIYWTATPESAVRRIYAEFKKNIADRYREEIEQSDFTLDQVVTLASIVELEAKIPGEKSRIAGLYLNRLNRNMRLQADPTVIYALGERRRLLYEDYRFEHPYNTYIHSGLPPGPISNPDLASIQAVIEPEEHDYLFMVASPDGSHRFSRTYEEHQAASAEWRRWIREQYRIRDELERIESQNR